MRFIIILGDPTRGQIFLFLELFFGQDFIRALFSKEYHTNERHFTERKTVGNWADFYHIFW